MTHKLKNWSIVSLLESQFISEIQMILVNGDWGNRSLIVTKDQTVYALGYECNNCQESCNNKGTFNKKEIKKSRDKIKTMTCSNEKFVLVLTGKGEVYSWSTCICQNSKNLPMDKQFNGKLNLNNQFAVDIDCTNCNTIVLTRTGNVHILNHFQETSVKEVLGQVFRSISCGADHCIAVTDNGQLYSWGSNSLGQLGLIDSTTCNDFSKITYLSGIVIEKVACGKNHTLALSNNGTLYCWGDNTYWQLGVSLQCKMSAIPIALKRLLKVSDIAASKYANISVAMGIGHKIFMWGECRGQSIIIPTLISVDSIHDVFALYALPTTMHQPFIIADEKEKKEDDMKIMKITDHIMAAFDNKTTSDLTMKVEGKPIYVHKLILKTRSKYFNAMFQGEWKENNDCAIEIWGFSYETYRTFLKFLYTNKIDTTIPIENVIELIKLADCYNEDNYKAGYLSVLWEMISTDNTALLFSIAVQYNDSILKRRCIQFAVTHMKEISMSSSFSELTQETMKNFIIEVVHHDCFPVKE